MSKQTAMSNLLEDLKLTKVSTKESIDIINDKFISKNINEYVQTTLDSVINRIENELLEMEKEQIIFAHVSSCNTMNCQKTAKEKLKCSCGQYFWEQNFK